MSPPNLYGRLSRAVLVTLHPLLRELCVRALIENDHSLLRGVRTVDDQAAFVHQGLSKIMDSRHLAGGGLSSHEPDYPELSYAVDMAPYIGGRVSYEARHVAYFAGCVMTLAAEMGIDLRWGGDWDSDGNQIEHAFWDGVHFELRRGIYQ